MDDLTGKLLIAMPGMGDPRFEKSVVLLCEHSERGAMGLIVNKAAEDVSAADLFGQLGIARTKAARPMRIHFGGPVELGRGFVLHSPDYRTGSGSLPVTEAIVMTATTGILEALGSGRGPDAAILLLGYAGWGPGQLEDELGQNGWLTGDSSPDIVFHADDAAKWALALKNLGIDAVALSAVAGHA